MSEFRAVRELGILSKKALELVFKYFIFPLIFNELTCGDSFYFIVVSK